MDVFGQNSSGDFDQYSIAGVDFGANYDENYGIMPTNSKGDTMSGEFYKQMGNITYAPEMGYAPQMGYAKQMGAPNYTMGSMIDDLKMKLALMSPTMKYATYAAAILGAVVVARKMGYIKQKLPLIG